MRILYILSGTEIVSGATKSFLTLMNSAREAGHEVAVVCNDRNGVFQLLQSEGVTTVCVPYQFASLPTVSTTPRDIVRFVPRFIRDRIANPKAGKAVLNFARTFRPDIIHENTSVTGVGYYVAKRLDLPLIIHIREYADRDFKIYLLNYKKRLRYKKAYPVAITKDLLSYRCERYGQGGKARVIYNGIVDRAPKDADCEKLPYFLYAGRVEPNKGIEDLIDAYISYRKEQGHSAKAMQLKIAGTCSNEAFSRRLHEKADRSGYGGDVVWLGECMDMESLYSRSAATIVPSLFEGFGRVPPEAMAQGSLCVMRDTGGLKEQMDNGLEITGSEIALRFSSVGELQSILARIAEDYFSTDNSAGSAFADMRARARTTVETLYTKKAYTGKFMELYNEIDQQQRQK